MPHHIVKATGGQMIKEWKLAKYKLNPGLKPNNFEKKKSLFRKTLFRPKPKARRGC
ncbi:MAG: hypothetical protein ABI977_04720 [Acidobacteriota bacterium]